jgi:hypothetical protein
VVVLLCIGAATEPAVSYLPMDICCQWCLGVTEVVDADAQAGDDAIVSVFAMAEAVGAEVLALAPGDKGCLWFAATPLDLLFLTRFATA